MGLARNSGDKGCGGEADTDGELLGEAMCALRNVDEDEVGEDEATEDEVEPDRFGREMGQQDGEGDGGEKDTGDEGAALTVVEVVAGFEVAGVEGVN